MNRIAVFLVLSMSFTTTSLAETQAEGGIARPGDTDNTALPSDGLAECAAILAVASTKATNIVERKSMENAAALWFATSGDVAAQEGALPNADVWEEKIVSWSAKIGSVAGLSQHGDWMRYCADLAIQQSLAGDVFAAHAPAAEEASEQGT